MGIFGWSYPPGAANDPFAPYNQDDAPQWYRTAQNNARRIFRELRAKTWGDVYRRLYKATDCGVTVGILLDGEAPIQYCDELYKYDLDDPVREVHISSIVEGVEQTTETERVVLTQRGTRKTGTALKRLYAACDEIERQAQVIWNETHGCDDCGTEGEPGERAVNPECKSCEGKGVII